MEYDPAIPRLFGWEKPVELDTRSRWERYDRKVVRGARPRAILVYEVTRKAYLGETTAGEAAISRRETVTSLREVSLYAFEQTKAFRPTSRTLAIRALADIFRRHSNRQHYIWNCEGEWKSCNGSLSFDRFAEHIAQNAIYGVRGGGRWTLFGGIDLDLHNGDPAIFLDQLTALLTELHGREGWHFQVADRDAQGVHLLQVLTERVGYEAYRCGLRARLQALDLKYPELARRANDAGMKSLGELEIFPNIKNGLRLPFCVGRSMLTDAPLALVLVRGKYAVDVERYIAWVHDPVSYMPLRDVYEYIATRLVVRQRSPRQTVDTIPHVVNREATASKVGSDSESTTKPASLRRRYAQEIQDFWSGKNTPPDSLNRAILLLANIAPYYHPSRESAVSAVEGMIDGLPDITFSDRLASGNRAAVSRVVVATVSSAFDALHGKEESSAKLAATYRTWAEKGFNPFDKSTWAETAGGMKLGVDFAWTPSEAAGLNAVQAILKTDAAASAAFVKEIVRFVAGHDGEIAVAFVRKRMTAHGIKPGSNRDRKANTVMNLLRDLNWIVLRSASRWHPRQSDKSQSPGLARRYGIGPALQHKFLIGDSLSLGEKADKHLLLRHHSLQPTFSQDELHDLVLEYARLKKRLSDVEPLSDNDRTALDQFISSS